SERIRERKHGGPDRQVGEKWPLPWAQTSPQLGEDVDELLAKPNQCGLFVGARVPSNEVAQPRNFEGEGRYSNPGRARVDLGGAPWQRCDQIRARNRQHRGSKIGYAQADAALLIVTGQYSVNNGAPRTEERKEDMGIAQVRLFRQRPVAEWMALTEHAADVVLDKLAREQGRGDLIGPEQKVDPPVRDI